MTIFMAAWMVLGQPTGVSASSDWSLQSSSRQPATHQYIPDDTHEHRHDRRRTHGLTIEVGDQAEPDAPPTTILIGDNDFYPEQRSLSDCLGLVERPGCGSPARGGAMQAVVFALLLGAFAFIAWRVWAGGRAARAQGSPTDRGA